MKKLLLFLCTFLCSVGMWADITSPWTVSSFSGSITSNSTTISNATWTMTASTVGSSANGAPAWSVSSNKWKFGNSKNQFWSSYTISTDAFADYSVTEVEIGCYDNGSTSSSVTVKQGSTTIGSASVSTTTTSTKKTINTTAGVGGTLSITYNSDKQASYITYLKVTFTALTPATTYTVTFNANTNGTCSTASLTEASAGAGVTLPSCTPNSNYGFVGWATTNDAASANAGKATEIYYPTADVTLYAVYANLYTVTIETPTNGTLVVKNGETVVNNGDQVANGTTLNVTATPNRGYAFRNWQAVDATTHTYTTTFTYDVASNVTIKANFNELAKYTVTLADDNTELTPEYGGEAVVLPSRSAIGAYTFAGWSETNVAVETTTTPTIIEAGAYVAAANVTLYPVYTRSEAGGTTDVPVSIKIADNLPAGTNSGDKVASFTLDENVTASSTGGDDSNSSKIYGSPLSQWRFYRSDNGAMTITTTTGTLKSVSVTYSVDKNGVMLHGTDEIASGTAVENINATSITFTAGGGETGKTNGVIRITDIAVVYTVDGQTTYYLSSPSVTPTTATITLNAACTDGSLVYGTYSNNSAWVVSDDIEVSEVGVIDGELVVEHYAVGAIVPANTGVMVSALEGGDYTVNLSNEAGSSVLGTDNCLHPSSETMTGNNLFYRLTMHNGNQIGFWWGAEEGAAFSLAANKAYLAVPKSAGGSAAVRGFAFNGGEATAIKTVNTFANNAVRYNLAGQRINANVKGIVIVNGKKLLVK